ncbi:uncharacterized protein LOC119390721 [Rhipicephalus sanguineus]|uniref:uncharacterized protein LOC119390721 n=1 Tax=Rhipicephalus sanguineus TaxID=34632 RepID=UPI0018947CC3|nr:uncharacterized protein LOC119390721 [Rhipicephalus sanguineus]
MATVKCMFVAFYIACGVLLHVYAWDDARWQCIRPIHHIKSVHHAVFVPQQDGTPCMHGYCFQGMCVEDENQRPLQRRKRSLRSFIAGFTLGRRAGLRQARRRSRMRGFGWR